METKICRTCKQEKPLSEFNKDKRQKDGYATQCKECKHAYDKARYERIKNDPEYHAKKLEHGKKYRETHKEQIKAYSDEYNMRPEVVQRKADWHQAKRENYSIEDRLKEIAHRAHNRALLKNVPCTITWKDLSYTEYCPLLEIKLNWGQTTNEGGRNIDTPSLDRINPNLGYVPGNVRIISNLANMMKSSATLEQLQTFYKNIWNYMKNEDIVRPIENKESIESEDKELQS